MANKKSNMQAIFKMLSDKNKDNIIQIAQNLKNAQKTTEQTTKNHSKDKTSL